jgi:hypothetical protein
VRPLRGDSHEHPVPPLAVAQQKGRIATGEEPLDQVLRHRHRLFELVDDQVAIPIQGLCVRYPARADEKAVEQLHCQ